MRRRELLFLLGVRDGDAASPAGAAEEADAGDRSSANTTPAVNTRLLPAFLQGRAETGWVEEQNVAIEYRWAEDRYEQLTALATYLVGRKVDLIVSTGGINLEAANGLGSRSRRCFSPTATRSSSEAALTPAAARARLLDRPTGDNCDYNDYKTALFALHIDS